METDMLYSFFVYFLAIAMGSMFEFLIIIGMFLIATPFLLTLAHIKNNPKLRVLGKCVNVALTVIGFINILADDLTLTN